ncbi:MAG: DUF4058 family protein [Pirellulaceae bacterium]|nr:DUF4058 family protein [Pirellulaceae bacterium]
MPSPFPGMDPFIEGQIWEDFHHELIGEIRHQLQPLVRPKYVTLVEKRVYIDRAEDDAPAQIVADVGLAAGQSGASIRATELAASGEPLLLDYPLATERREAFLTIRDARNRNIVTIIEVLSPANKRPGGDGRAEYLKKRAAILDSEVNLVELDLLRGGARLPMVQALPAADYLALVRQQRGRHQAAIRSWRLPDPLPTIAVPLLVDDGEVALDLAAAFTNAYDRAGYDAILNYDLPIDPQLSPSEAAWAREVLAARRTG